MQDLLCENRIHTVDCKQTEAAQSSKQGQHSFLQIAGYGDLSSVLSERYITVQFMNKRNTNIC